MGEDNGFDLVVDNMPAGRIGRSDTHGHGLFARYDVPKGAVVGTMDDGQVIGWDDFDALVARHSDGLGASSDLLMEWNALSEDTLLVRPFRTKYSFVNHSRTPNVRIARHPLRLVALRDIAEGEEFLLDYRKGPLRREYLEGHGTTCL